MNLKNAKILSKVEQKSINGGLMSIEPASCSAKCLDQNGNEYTVTCSGANCEANEYNGCSSDTESKSCL